MSSLPTPILAAEQSPPTAPARSGYTYGCSAYTSTEHSRQGGSTSPFSLGAGTGVAAPAPAFGSAVSNNTGPYILSGFGRLASSTAPGRNLFAGTAPAPAPLAPAPNGTKAPLHGLIVKGEWLNRIFDPISPKTWEIRAMPCKTGKTFLIGSKGLGIMG